MRIFIALMLLFIFIFAGCVNEPVTLNKKKDSDSEVFLTEDKPTFDLYTYDVTNDYTYKMMIPWNYNKDFNAGRKYPLVVSLHGGEEVIMLPVLLVMMMKCRLIPVFLWPPMHQDTGVHRCYCEIGRSEPDRSPRRHCQ